MLDNHKTRRPEIVPYLLMTGPRPGSEDVGQAVEVGGVGWGWGTRPKGGCWWWWWWGWSTTRRSIGRMAVAAGGTCMGSAAELTSTGEEEREDRLFVRRLFSRR